MSEELDWSGLEKAVATAATRIAGLREDNLALRKEVKDLRKQLEALAAEPTVDPRLTGVRERLQSLESTLEGLLP